MIARFTWNWIQCIFIMEKSHKSKLILTEFWHSLARRADWNIITLITNNFESVIWICHTSTTGSDQWAGTNCVFYCLFLFPPTKWQLSRHIWFNFPTYSLVGILNILDCIISAFWTSGKQPWQSRVKTPLSEMGGGSLSGNTKCKVPENKYTTQL